MKVQTLRAGVTIATAHFRGIKATGQRPIGARAKPATAPKAKRLSPVKFAGIGGAGAPKAVRAPHADAINPNADRIARQRAIDALWDRQWQANSGGAGAPKAVRAPQAGATNPNADRIARQSAIDALWDRRWQVNSRP